MAGQTVDQWLTSRTYSTIDKAAAAWLGRHKRQRASGQPPGPIAVTVLGGGWWHVSEPGTVARRASTKLQGFGALGAYLLSRGQLQRADGSYQLLADDGPGTPPGPEQAASAPAPEPGKIAQRQREADRTHVESPYDVAPPAPPVRLQQLEQDARALLAAIGALAAVHDSARTTAALGYVRLACEELKQARIVAEVRAKYADEAEQDAAWSVWWTPARTNVRRG
jgi:hypothetical protein